MCKVTSRLLADSNYVSLFIELFLWIFPLIWRFPPCVFEFSWSVPSKNLSMRTWEPRNIKRSPPPHRITPWGSSGWGSSPKIQREIKREVFFLRVRKGQVTSGEVLLMGMSTQAIIYYALRNSVNCSMVGSTGRPARIPLVRELQKSPPLVHRCNAPTARKLPYT